MDRFSQPFIDRQQFINAGAALEFITLAGHQFAHQTLRKHTRQRGREQVRLNPHVDQPRHRPCRRIGVQCRQHQMPGEGGLHGNLRGFQIADFTDHDHVRILPQNCPQGARKGHLDFRIDLRLADPIEVVFDRVFHRHDVSRGCVEP